MGGPVETVRPAEGAAVPPGVSALLKAGRKRLRGFAATRRFRPRFRE